MKYVVMRTISSARTRTPCIPRRPLRPARHEYRIGLSPENTLNQLALQAQAGRPVAKEVI